MFTGIVQARCKVASMTRNSFGARLRIDTSNWSPAGGYVPGHGDSICVSGVCLTVAELSSGGLVFDVIAETLSKSTLGSLKVGSEVNIEPAVLPTQPLGGHFMQGHVDAVAEVVAVKDSPQEWRTTIKPPVELLATIIPKGSIAIDGVSLTIASVAEDRFDVALIPTTLKLTTLADRKPGDKVNIEADILAKTLVNYLEKFTAAGGSSALTMQKLRDAGI